jgi:hypothetical protein
VREGGRGGDRKEAEAGREKKQQRRQVVYFFTDDICCNANCCAPNCWCKVHNIDIKGE